MDTKTAEFEKNKLLLAEAEKNYTDYVNLMDPIITKLELEYNTAFNYRESAETYVTDWVELRGEFDGYMAVITSFGIAKGFTYADLG